jgi:hypothetical protein
MQFVINGSSSSKTSVKKIVINNNIADDTEEAKYTNLKLKVNGSQV